MTARRLHRTLRAAAAAAVLLAAAACGVPTVPASQAVPVGSGSSLGAAGSGAGAPGGLATASTTLGTVVTSDGHTLYRFAKDTATPSKATCTGDCAKSWPPVLGDGVPALKGVPPEWVGTVGRPDGSQQITLNGWPLYRYAKDTAPGDVKGQGVGGAWSAIGRDGKPVATVAPSAPAPAPAPAPADTSTGSGY
jgi:predicted lipoprotein with Yx(FWY)xxD motif